MMKPLPSDRAKVRNVASTRNAMICVESVRRRAPALSDKSAARGAGCARMDSNHDRSRGYCVGSPAEGLVVEVLDVAGPVEAARISAVV